jgi:hypothetical protein
MFRSTSLEKKETVAVFQKLLCKNAKQECVFLTF